MTADVAVVQTKPRKGDVAANLAAVGDAFATLERERAEHGRPLPRLIVFPEAALTGYFLEGAVYELALRAADVAARLDAAWRARAVGEVDVVLGFFENDAGTYYNSALAVTLGAPGGPRIAHVHRKLFLPTYGVFDEERFLSRGRRLDLFDGAFGRSAVLICEDAWHGLAWTVAALKGARLVIVPSASPGRGLAGPGLGSTDRWHAILTTAAAEHGVYVLYAGLTGFEGGKGMSGSSCIVSPGGDLIVTADPLETTILRATLDDVEVDLARARSPLLGDLGAVLPDLWLDAELPLPRLAFGAPSAERVT